MTKKIKAAIIGASGYSGEELIRILSNHNECQIKIITSRQYDGIKIGEVFPRFAESKLTFSAPDVNKIIAECNVAFLALPHGLASEYAAKLVNGGVTTIDISADFRLRSLNKYKEYYNQDHPAPELLKDAVYGLPERYRESIKNAKLIACPGCYPTSSILPTAPLLEKGLASKDKIIISSMSGVTGAGRKVALPFIFPETNESLRAYGITGHRHLPEIEQELAAAFGCDAKEVAINFIPHLVPVNRGINSTIILEPTSLNITVKEIYKVYQEYYANEPFVRIKEHGNLADTKNVTLSNMCEIGFTYDKHTNKIIITSCIDNLTKGASGQAVQCMNIIFGLEETLGLK
ncbi:N-acetyl-gamma-glutamyl-phosphate reductase [Lentisphaerota bacterium WC36G]|nr:N-acetyl-gamma-glutamyl-phosphate reductase [Lentisphaerae bacterium WC36]